jgi:hypothetical protein
MWKKRGLLLRVKDHATETLCSHASIPFAFHISDDLYRIYFSSRNHEGQSFPYYIDGEVTGGAIKLLGKPVGPLLELGALGTFDDSGMMPTCALRHSGRVYLYYIGWNPQVTVSYRLSIGLAVSDDDGRAFTRYSASPVCDRSLEEPFFNTAPYVLIEDRLWRMWYISCTRWTIINGHPEPSYHVKYAESTDGIHWNKEGTVCLDYDDRAKALGRPSVIYSGGKYRMYFSYRDTADYRDSPSHAYKIGLAESTDGVNWLKQYGETGIDLSSDGWDSVMMEYCHVFRHGATEYMLYNGNGFGKEGFGYATQCIRA